MKNFSADQLNDQLERAGLGFFRFKDEIFDVEGDQELRWTPRGVVLPGEPTPRDAVAVERWIQGYQLTRGFAR